MRKRGLPAYLGMQQEETYHILQEIIDAWPFNTTPKDPVDGSDGGDGNDSSGGQQNAIGDGIHFTNSRRVVLNLTNNLRDLPDGGQEGMDGWGATVRALDADGQPIPGGVTRLGYITVKPLGVVS